ncbi:metal-dependent hydrolase [Adonisia turfae]|uniref:Hydrolase n=1 Tax=Adonisia turfae CCMR0081 TaxID=2292702 RepID=A0A6M0RXU3_9CYAN|nr:metal-dependent hydrolase [Adonisia turfae]NEZ61035.1 hydrolase [Adonisia turfae CCMR0081]
MMARNHIPFAMSCWWLVAIGAELPIEAQGTMTAAVGGMLPDLDHPGSALGRRLKLISLPLSAVVGHRGVTHSLLAVVALIGVLVTVATVPVYSHLGWLITPLTIGYLSHILGDSLTPSGVPLFWPRKTTYSMNLFKTRSWQETLFVGLFTFSTVIFGGVVTAAVNDFWQRVATVSQLFMR